MTKYTEEIRIRVSRENKAAIQAAADRASLDMSSWCRTKLIPIAENEIKTIYQRQSEFTRGLR